MNYNCINIKVNHQEIPNIFIGSTLRGAFGYILKERVCTYNLYDCISCQDKNNCLYYDYYEANDGYRPFRFDIKLNPKNYDFNFYIFEENTLRIYIIIQVLQEMLLSGNIGKNKLVFIKNDIFLDREKIIFNQEGMADSFIVSPQTLTIDKFHSNISIKLITPCIIKANSNFKIYITLEDILLSIYKRKYYFENKAIIYKLNYTPNYQCISSELSTITTKRRSDRQNKTIMWEGVIGELVISDLDPISYNLLKWGEIIGIGSKTVFGYGSILIKSISMSYL